MNWPGKNRFPKRLLLNARISIKKPYKSLVLPGVRGFFVDSMPVKALGIVATAPADCRDRATDTITSSIQGT